MVSKRASWQETSPARTADRAVGTALRVLDTALGRVARAGVLASALAGALVLGLPGLGPTAASGAVGAVAAGTAAAGPGTFPARAPALRASTGSGAPSAGTGATLLATPLLSPARVPLTLQGLGATRQLGAQLGQALSARAITASGASHSCVVVAQAGQVIFSYHPDLAVAPASNMKLLTATAALDVLGPSYRFHTRLEASSAPVGGVLDGNLYLVGGGDPLLRLPAYAATVEYGGPVYTNADRLASELKAAGVTEVQGSVVADGSRYDSQTSVAAWPARFAQQGDVGPLSAVDIDDGLPIGGGPGDFSTSPAQQSAQIVANLLGQDGIHVEGGAMAGTAPASGLVTLVDLESPPLSAELGEILRESDNTAMELITKELGLHVRGSGTTAAGTAVVRADLERDGIPVGGMVNLDGSGLSPSDRVTCTEILDVLERSGPHGLLVRDLPVAARSGTLYDQLRGTPAAGRVRAKTGTLDQVKALSGWVEAATGQGDGNAALAQPVVFACVLNEIPGGTGGADGAGAPMVDRLAVDLAQYPKPRPLALYDP